MSKLVPSHVRNYCESRVRKLAGTYTFEQRIQAIDDIVNKLREYRKQLVVQKIKREVRER